MPTTFLFSSLFSCSNCFSFFLRASSPPSTCGGRKRERDEGGKGKGQEGEESKIKGRVILQETHLVDYGPVLHLPGTSHKLDRQKATVMTTPLHSVSQPSAGVTAQMMAILAFSLRDGFRMCVSFESRYRMWMLRRRV